MESQVNASPAVTPRSIGIKWGLISAVVSTLIFLILVFSGVNPFDNIWNWIKLAISAFLVFLAHKNYKDSGNGFMSYGQGVGIAFWIALIAVIIETVVRYCYINFVDLSIMDMVYQKQSEELAARGMQDDQINMAMSLAKIVFWPSIVFLEILFGVIIGLIVSIFTQKKNPEPAF